MKIDFSHDVFLDCIKKNLSMLINSFRSFFFLFDNYAPLNFKVNGRKLLPETLWQATASKVN